MEIKLQFTLYLCYYLKTDVLQKFTICLEIGCIYFIKIIEFIIL